MWKVAKNLRQISMQLKRKQQHLSSQIEVANVEQPKKKRVRKKKKSLPKALEIDVQTEEMVRR